MTQNGIALSVQDLHVSYGNIKAVKGISFDVHEREIVTLIGANGAGKSSTLRALSGVVPYSGGIAYMGQNLHNVPADRIVGMGIAQVPEGRGIFGNLTVLENLTLATWQRKDKQLISRNFDYSARRTKCEHGTAPRFPRICARDRQYRALRHGRRIDGQSAR